MKTLARQLAESPCVVDALEQAMSDLFVYTGEDVSGLVVSVRVTREGDNRLVNRPVGSQSCFIDVKEARAKGEAS